MKKIYLLIGSQNLYGQSVIETIKNHGQEMSKYFSEKIRNYEINFLGVVTDSSTCIDLISTVNNDKNCIGVITWMHTFSPAKMWIKGLQILNKPLCHLHTQYNEKLPYETIDMDFMNLNQAAHGDREYSFILARLGINHDVVSGFYKHQNVIEKLINFADVSNAIDYSKKLKVACFGNNMREVAVTDGDRVESQIKYGWEVNYYAIGDVVESIDAVSNENIDELMKEYSEKYTFKTNNIEAVRTQAQYELGFEKFLKENDIGAFTDTFQDLHGLKQLPGLAIQRLTKKGYGFAAEGDYKTAALAAVLSKMAEFRDGATGFMEDYTYDLTEGEEIELGSHMLEVPETFASSKPSIEVHPLGIGGKEDPARLVFDGITGNAVACCLVDMGDHFRLVVANYELIKQPKEMPKLPVARIMWKILPSFEEGTRRWLEAGGGHHTVVSTALTNSDIELFAKLTNTEVVIIK